MDPVDNPDECSTEVVEKETGVELAVLDISQESNVVCESVGTGIDHPQGFHIIRDDESANKGQINQNNKNNARGGQNSQNKKKDKYDAVERVDGNDVYCLGSWIFLCSNCNFALNFECGNCGDCDDCMDSD